MPMQLRLPPDEIHLWLTFGGESTDASRLAEYRRVMSADELEREQRFRFAHDQRRHVVTRAFVRTVLSRYAERTPDYWRFAADAYGRPHLLNGEGSMREVSFNLSHTAGLIVCALSSGGDIGADAENFQERPIALEIFDSCFTAAEAAALRALPVDIQGEHFFHYWTLKEAYVKAKGRGLSIPLKQVGFVLPPGNGGGLSFHSELDGPGVAYRFWLLQPSPEHLAAVCARRHVGDGQRLVVRTIDPLGREQAFACPVLRESR